ncbi:ParA family protein [Renibacterium salmoninarum]|uniref:ParA family protein n=1 Tax=Renibacterium salmoninarum TaxID=1646 RepID=UPI0005A1B7E7|nr:AAA family ATPase [Renibacterium salmoninarum]
MQVVSISSLKGGVGKTSVTLGLASAALAAGIPTLVIDLDPHADATTGLGVRADAQLDIGRMLKNPRKANLAGQVAPSGWIENAIARAASTSPTAAVGRRSQRTHQGDSHPVLDVAVGSAYAGIFDRPDLGKRDLRRLSAVLAGLDRRERVLGDKPDYELVLIDCPPSLNGLTRIAWTASNKVLLVAEPGLFSVAGTERTLRAIDLFRNEFTPGLSAAGIVANRVRQSSAEHQYRLDEMATMFGSLLLSPTMEEQTNWQQIQGAARSVHQWPGEAAKNAAAGFDELLQQILGATR